MLVLKDYQKRVLDELGDFLKTASALNIERGLRLAYLDHLGDDAKPYKPLPELENVPFLCIKVPTGGGKTLIATYSIKTLQDSYVQVSNGKGLVVWFVPTDAIRTQTLSALKDRNHPYRAALDVQFNNQVKVFSIEEALSIQKSDLDDNLCIVVSSLAAFRRSDPTWLKVSQNNGALITHFENVIEELGGLDKEEDGTLIYSLTNVIRMYNPIIIVDEGHNAQTQLSFDMLRGLNPAFVLEYTATPRAESNVLIKVSAAELKAEKMVKIPIYLTSVPQWQEAIRDGVAERNKLEKIASKEKAQTKEYIRPIALLQAEQEKESDTKVYVGQVKEFLLKELKVPEEEIAIKTAKQDEIKGINLLSSTSKIKYIITVNALKEGWDCPFAYVLISVANVGSTVSVEQTIGRILRLPNASDKKAVELNSSYVYASSESFSKASNVVINGLESNGYSRADLRENKGGVLAEKNTYERDVKDDNIAIPYMSIKGSKEPLAYNRDLLSVEMTLPSLFKPFEVDFHSDQNRKVKIDVDKETGVYRIIQGKLALILNPEDFSRDELTSWLKKNVRHNAVSSDEMGGYIEKSLNVLFKSHTLEELSVNRFRLKGRLQEEAQGLIQGYSQKKFNKLLEDKKLVANEVIYSPDKSITMSRTTAETFQKHLFEKAGNLNGEELDFAFRLDGLDNVAWWFRNREKEDFYLQGWKSGKFYPDFIVKTKSGQYVLIEYKGEDRLSNEDTAYKVELGELWEKLNDKAKFYLVGKATSDEVVKSVSSL